MKSLLYVLQRFLYIFHFKIPYFSRLKFTNLSVDLQTMFNPLTVTVYGTPKFTSLYYT